MPQLFAETRYVRTYLWVIFSSSSQLLLLVYVGGVTDGHTFLHLLIRTCTCPASLAEVLDFTVASRAVTMAIMHDGGQSRGCGAGGTHLTVITLSVTAMIHYVLFVLCR